jgi:hypothetical protein
MLTCMVVVLVILTGRPVQFLRYGKRAGWDGGREQQRDVQTEERREEMCANQCSSNLHPSSPWAIVASDTAMQSVPVQACH